MKLLKTLIVINILFFGMAIPTFAQNLSSTQNIALQAPGNIKIDGKATEWNERFQAYNSASRVFYTLCNDDAKLYLIAKMEGKTANRKVLYGGITLELFSSLNKTKKIIIRYHALVGSVFPEQISLNPTLYNKFSKDSTVNKRKNDSLIIATNNLLSKNFNTLSVEGIPEIKEPVISIYNTEGIEVAAKMNNVMEYTYELAIPLHYLKDILTTGGNIKYVMRVNARPALKAGQFAPPSVRGDAAQQVNFENMYLNNSSEFSGEYPLVKK